MILSGMSGTGKTKLAQAFAELLQVDDDGTNYLFLPVRPDWRDNKALVGYYNPILCQYESTELLRFVLDALGYARRRARRHWLTQSRLGLRRPSTRSGLRT